MASSNIVIEVHEVSFADIYLSCVSPHTHNFLLGLDSSYNLSDTHLIYYSSFPFLNLCINVPKSYLLGRFVCQLSFSFTYIEINPLSNNLTKCHQFRIVYICYMLMIISDKKSILLEFLNPLYKIFHEFPIGYSNQHLLTLADLFC